MDDFGAEIIDFRFGGRGLRQRGTPGTLPDPLLTKVAGASRGVSFHKSSLRITGDFVELKIAVAGRGLFDL
ncbi:MAG: hypothetical protein ACXWOH_13060, partial [Bdellovibrionota bacterium]